MQFVFDGVEITRPDAKRTPLLTSISRLIDFYDKSRQVKAQNLGLISSVQVSNRECYWEARKA